MILIIASEIDYPAQQLAERWVGSDAILLTPKDLSMPGWQFRVGGIEHLIGVGAGRHFSSADVRGVVTRLPYISEHELPHIVSSDRVYVAAEMHAFLLAWLTQLPCPVLNRPTVNSLAGPAWRQERWVTIAAGLGVPIFPFSRRITIQNSRSAQELNASSHKLVTVVGKQCLGSSNSLLTDWAFALANAAKADALSMEFIGTGRDLQFVSATPFLDIANEQVALAMSNYFGVIED